MVILAIAGLLGFSIGFFAGAGYATRGAGAHRDEAEQYAAECQVLEVEVAQLRQVLHEPPSRVVPKEHTDALRKLVG